MARRPPTHLGDMQMGHGCFPPTRNIQASPNVLVNHRFVIRDGDIFEPHHCGWDDDGNPKDFHYPMARGDKVKFDSHKNYTSHPGGTRTHILSA